MSSTRAASSDETRALSLRSLLELGHAPRRRLQRTPGIPRVAPAHRLLGADEGVEQLELVRRPRKPALGELARQDEQPLGRRDDVLARDAPAPGIGPRAAVRADPARDHEARLVLRPELTERLEALLLEEALRHLELGLDERLGRGGANRGRVALRAEEQPDRLGDDRLPRAGLARQRNEPRVELEVCLADQDEVFDPQPAQHGVIVDRPRSGRQVSEPRPR